MLCAGGARLADVESSVLPHTKAGNWLSLSCKGTQERILCFWAQKYDKTVQNGLTKCSPHEKLQKLYNNIVGKMEKNMKKITILALLVAFFVSSTFADELRKSGDCKIQEAKMFDNDKIVSVKVQNAEIQAQCKIYSGMFIDDYALSAIPWITNLGGKKVHVSYHVAFFDSKGELVACVSQSAEIPADASGYQLGSSMVMIPKATIEKIASYKIVIYTSESKGK